MPSIESHYGAYIVRYRGGSELVQIDYSYPRTAEQFGWNLRRVQPDKDGGSRVLQRAPNRGHGCDHRGTDGTVNCPDCGVSASAFISAAGDFLDSIAL